MQRKFVWMLGLLALLVIFVSYLTPAQAEAQSLPKRVDLSFLVPEVYDQGSSDACTVYSFVAALNAELAWLDRRVLIDPGRRVDPAETVRRIGNRIALLEGKTCYTRDGRAVEVLETVPLYSVEEIKRVLAQGHLVLLGMNVNIPGIAVYNGTYVLSPKSHRDPSLDLLEKLRNLPTHQVAAVGYDDAKQAFKIVNSWGEEWGDGGFGWVSYAYVASVVDVDRLNSSPQAEYISRIALLDR